MSGLGIAQLWCPSKELGPNYDFGPKWARNRREKLDLKQLSFWAHEPLRNGKKTCPALESLNSYVRARSKAQITILGLNEDETDVKNWTSSNSASELTNPLEMVKKHVRLWNRSILMSELGVRPKFLFWCKKSDFKEFSFWAHEPLRNGKKNISGLGIAQFWCPS